MDGWKPHVAGWIRSPDEGEVALPKVKRAGFQRLLPARLYRPHHCAGALPSLPP